MRPAVSVLLPARNAAGTVELAVRSMLSQSVRELELIAIDDRSTDATGDVLRRLAREDERVRVIEGPGRGLVAALNLGLSACRADYIARMDADDESFPRRLERSLAALEADQTLAAVGTQLEIFRTDRPVSPNMAAYGRWLSSLTTPERTFSDRFVESPLCHPASTLRHAALDAVGGWKEGPFPEDYRLWLELFSGGWRLSNVPEVLFRWRDHDERLTRADPRYGADRHLALKAKFLAKDVLHTGRCILWGAGQTGLALGRLLVREGVVIDRFVEVSPKKIGQRLEGAPVIAPDALGGPGELHLVSAVGAKGARDQIRTFLVERGWVEGRHFTCAA